MYPLLFPCNTFLCLARLHPSHLMEDIFPGCWVNGYSYKPAKMQGTNFFDLVFIKVFCYQMFSIQILATQTFDNQFSDVLLEHCKQIRFLL